MRHSSWRAVTALICLLLAGCTEDPDPPEEPTPPATARPPLLETRPTATDGGAIEVAETGFSVIEQRDTGSVIVAWAATLTNTSETDLLAYADFELTWRSAAGETEVFRSTPSPLQRIYDVLPGRMGVIGGGDDTLGLVPVSLDVKVDTIEWYPMRDLEANGRPVGVEVTDFRIDVEAVSVHFHVQYTTAYNRGPDGEVHLLVVMRNAAGRLLGAHFTGPYLLPATSPGPHERDSAVRRSWWPDEADPDTSDVAVAKVCCTWVGVR